MRTPLLHELFEANAAKEPSAIAIKAPFKQITYGELAAFVHSLAQQLIGKNVKNNQLIAIVMEKGWEQVVATLSILKSGAAYLPIDPTESTERLHYLLQISEAQIILTQEKFKNRLSWPKNKFIIEVDKLPPVSQEASYDSLNHSPASPDDLAYVIFTSGSTGAPKGVMITHQSAVNTILDINERFNINTDDRIFALSNLNFDLSVYDIFGSLAAGGTIILPTADQAQDPTQWPDLFYKEKISVWNSVPALMDIFAEYINHKRKKTDSHKLRLVLLSGDWIPLNLPQKIRSLFGNIQIISLGGATEASIWSILYSIQEINPNWKSIPYGKAMKNQAFYILNENLEQVQNNESGELFIGGIGVAKGYWRDCKRTNNQFISHPVFGIIYKTGDLGRYLPDGNIEFLGRVDFQIKISGYRVEINAIEKYLLEFPSIKQALVCVVKDRANQKLIAYLKFDYDQIAKQQQDYSAIETEQVYFWQKVYDELCLEAIDDSILNTTGWISSYLHESIPKIQMEEWIECTTKRIKLLQPQLLLEIGSGMGLLLFRLAKVTRQYDAVDFSKSAIQYVENQLDKLHIDNVELIQYEANEIEKLNKAYDTILLNSVIQYFPSIDYLVDVLDKCVDKIKSKGHIFVGDVRSLHHLNAFHASVFLNKKTNHLTYEEWKNLLAKSVEEEDELIIDFNFFHAYKAKNKRVSHIEVRLKEGKFHNEMNCYRYDVILYIDQPNETLNEEVIWKEWDRECDGCSNIEAINSTLSQTSPNLLAIRNIPNKRTITYTDTKFFEIENWRDVIEEQLVAKKNNSIDPEIFYQIASKQGYYASVTFSIANPLDAFDLILVKQHPHGIPKGYLSLLQRNTNNGEEINDWRIYSNFPLLPRINRKMIPKVKNFLQARLPFYMMPNYFIPIKELPITANGKIDRKTLPMIIDTLPEKEYVKPHTDTQNKLALIWQKTLGVQNIGIRHNFHDLGGTSLLAVQLIINIYDELKVDLSLRELNTCSFNIENLALLIEKKHLQLTPS